MSPVKLQDSQLQFGAITFFAQEHKGETCGSNGLPLTPNSIIIYGKAQILKTIEHPYLCRYLDVIRGKHERTVVVSQYCGEQLSAYVTRNTLKHEDVTKIAYQILSGLNVIHDMGIVHRNLGLENILMQSNGELKLFNYGLYHMTGKGKLVTFPIIQLLYAAPEVYLQSPNGGPSSPKVDVWSLGVILVELVLGVPLWPSLKLSQSIRKVLSFIHSKTSVFERIAREHNCYEKYKDLPDDLKNLIDDCLKIYPRDRPSAKALLQRDIFARFSKTDAEDAREPFEPFTIKEFYHWWQLAGGEVLQELKKQGLIRSTPPILSLPNLVLLDGTVMSQERNPATLLDTRVVVMPPDAVYQRFQHIPWSHYYPLIHFKTELIRSGEPKLEDATNLPLVIREKDPEYQFHRVILLRRLLYGYPYTRDLIVKEAEKDIPPLLRGDVWAALLDVKGDYQDEYARIDKETPTPTDRQIEVDIPRCHQYNEFLSSTDGHRKLKRVLKAWVCSNKNYVYWQGLDSLTAPFLYLNFNDEAKAFACLSAFVPKYLHKFFLKDNTPVIQEYLAKFSQLIEFHDPILANHLQEINFIPQLFAIPWFLTMFSHVFPLHKILHLWDKLLLGDSSFALHIGFAVLSQLRSTLLESGFNECILLFSDLPEVDIEQCVSVSEELYNTTPRSITQREHQNEKYATASSKMAISPSSLPGYGKELSPRISVDDFVELMQNSPNRVIVVDTRNPMQHTRQKIIDSLNIPSSSVKYGETNIESLGPHCTVLKENLIKIVVVIGTDDTNMDLFSKYLVQCNVHKVCIFDGNMKSLQTAAPQLFAA